MTQREDRVQSNDETGRTATADAAEQPAAKRRSPDDLPPAARRALDEAEERRRNAVEVQRAKEVGGRGGKDPARYGDWEVKGRAIDF